MRKRPGFTGWPCWIFLLAGFLFLLAQPPTVSAHPPAGLRFIPASAFSQAVPLVLDFSPVLLPGACPMPPDPGEWRRFPDSQVAPPLPAGAPFRRGGRAPPVG